MCTKCALGWLLILAGIGVGLWAWKSKQHG